MKQNEWSGKPRAPPLQRFHQLPITGRSKATAQTERPSLMTMMMMMLFWWPDAKSIREVVAAPSYRPWINEDWNRALICETFSLIGRRVSAFSWLTDVNGGTREFGRCRERGLERGVGVEVKARSLLQPMIEAAWMRGDVLVSEFADGVYDLD